MMGGKSYISTAAGNFRFPALPPGSFTVTAQLQGFKTLANQGILIRTGMVVTLDIKMELTPIKEEVVITGTAPVVDIQQSKISVPMSQELIQNLPIARDLYDVINIAPGAILDSGTVSVHGSSVRSNTFTLDGININDPVVQTPVSNVDFDIMEEVEIVTAGQPASVPYTDGAYINVVTRSGGNKFSGGALIYFTDTGLAQQLWTDEQIKALNVSKPGVDKRGLDGSISLGGPVVRDKLWFFGSYRYLNREQTTNFIPWTDSFGTYHGPYDWKADQDQAFFKLTAQLNSQIKLSGMVYFTRQSQPMDADPAPYLNFSATHSRDDTNYALSGLANWIANQNTYVDVRVNYDRRNLRLLLQDSVTDLPYMWDYGNSYGGLTAPANETYIRTRFQTGAYFTHFEDDFLGGSHEFKGGLEFEHAYADYNWWRKDNLVWDLFNGPYLYGYETHNGVPNVGTGRIWFETCGPAESSTVVSDNVQRIGGFVQDSWTILKRVTLNLGLRYDYSQGSVPPGTKAAGGNPLSTFIGKEYVVPYTASTYPDTFPNGINPFGEIQFGGFKNLLTWNNLSPRIGLVFDIFGNGKTAFKASFARYPEFMMIQYFDVFHPFYWNLFPFTWWDMNGNGTPDTGDDYALWKYDYRVMDPAFSKLKLDPNATSPLTDEFTAGLWHELGKDFSIGLSYIYKNKFNFYENVLWSPDTREYWYNMDQPAAQKYWVPFTAVVPSADYGDSKVTFYVRKNDAPALFYRSTNVPELTQKYQALEFSFNKRMTHGWQLSGSIVLSKSYGNMGGWYWDSSGRGSAADDPNYFVNRDGRTNLDVPLQIKLMGSALLPWNFMASAYFRHLSGYAWQRECYIIPPDKWLQQNDAQFDWYWVAIEPAGKRRAKSSDFLDLRVEKEIDLWKGGRLGLFVDVLNVLGETDLTVGQNDAYIYHPVAENDNTGFLEKAWDYKTISAVWGVRTIKLSARFSF
jgi:hypothetical protein